LQSLRPQTRTNLFFSNECRLATLLTCGHLHF
jgi:hypothetical protein